MIQVSLFFCHNFDWEGWSGEERSGGCTIVSSGDSEGVGLGEALLLGLGNFIMVDVRGRPSLDPTPHYG